MSKLTAYKRHSRQQSALVRREADLQKLEAANTDQGKIQSAKDHVAGLYKKLGMNYQKSVK